MNVSGEVHIHAGRHAGKFGRIVRVWASGYRVRIHDESRGAGPKIAMFASNEVSPVSGVELLARIGRKKN